MLELLQGSTVRRLSSPIGSRGSGWLSHGVREHEDIVGDLAEPENRYERPFGKLLERTQTDLMSLCGTSTPGWDRLFCVRSVADEGDALLDELRPASAVARRDCDPLFEDAAGGREWLTDAFVDEFLDAGSGQLYDETGSFEVGEG